MTTPNSNLASILGRSAAAFGSKTAVIAGDASLDYATLDTFARMFAGALRDLGVRPGEHVALVCRTSPSSASPTSVATTPPTPSSR